MNVFYKVVNKLEHYLNVALSNFSAKFRPSMLSNIDESLDILVKEKSSLIRFRDGEFHLMLNGRFLVPRTTSLAFQNADAKLDKRLVGILKDSTLQLHNCKIAIPYPFVDYKKCGLTENAIAFWSQYLKVYRHKIWKMINLNYRYLDTQLSRFYMDFADKSESTMEKRILHLKQLWDQEDLLFVEGPNSKLGLGNDLFDNALSI